MKIITDSAADLSPEEAAEWGIQVIPLLIQFPEGEVTAESMTPDAFYDRLRSMAPQVPTTSQPSPGTFADAYRQAAAEGEDVLSIHLAATLSGTYNSAKLGMEQTPEARVTLVDTRTVSCALRLQVLAAAMALKAGWALPDILARLAEIHAAAELVYTLETLEYLARGGRIGRVQALAGSLLRVKPIITPDKADGKQTTAGRARTISQALTMMTEMVRCVGPDEPLWVTVMHGQYADRAEEFADLLRQDVNVGRLEIRRISPVLGVHTGPGVVGASAVPMRLMEDLL